MSTGEEYVSISYYMEEMENEGQDNFNIEKLMAEIDNTDLNDEFALPQMINYNENFTVKELLLICEYYGFAKDLKINKFNKEQIIDFLVSFETDPKNSDIVCKRGNMWFYINELKNDKFMKKYVIW